MIYIENIVENFKFNLIIDSINNLKKYKNN